MEHGVFADRAEAGALLARTLSARHWPGPCVVLALPRGGVPVGAAVARALKAPMDLLLVRKICAPWQPELAAAAVVEGDPPLWVVDDATCSALGLSRQDIEAQIPKESMEIERRRRAYLRGRPRLDVAGATVIVVDDGIATGTTVRAALRALRARGPARLVLAVPVAAAETLAELKGSVDELICLHTPKPLRAISQHYRDFHQVGDEEVIQTLESLQPSAAPEVRAGHRS